MSRLRGRRWLRWTLPPLLLACLSAGLVVHRIHIDRPVGRTLESFDLATYFLPAFRFMHDQLERGELPTWNPYQYAGQPYLGFHATGVLYPPNLVLLALFRPARALEMHFALHVFLAGLLTFLLARRLGLAPAPSGVAAAGYMLSGATLYGLYHPTFLGTQVYLPGVLWAVHGLAREPRLRWSAGLAALVALSFLAGQAQQFLYTVQLGLLYGLFALGFVARSGRRMRVAGHAAVSGLLALGLAAPQLLPALEFLGSSTRDLDGLSFEHAALGSLPLRTLLEGLLGQLPGPDGGAPMQASLLKRVNLPALTLPLVLCGALSRRHRAHWGFFLVCAAAAGLFMAGRHTPVFSLYYHLPLGNLFRIPARMAFAYALVLSLLAATGVHALACEPRWSGARRRIARAAALVLSLLLLADLYAGTRLDSTHPILSPPGGARPEKRLRLTGGESSLERTFVVTSPAPLWKSGMTHARFVLPDYEPNMPSAYARYFGVPRDAPWPGILGILPGERTRDEAELRRLLDLMSVRYYLAIGSLDPAQRAAIERFARAPLETSGRIHVAERTQAAPRAYVAGRVLPESDSDAALATLIDPAFRPGRDAVAGGVPSELLGSPPGPERAPRGTARIARYRPKEVRIRAQCRSRCLVVLTDLHYPGWRAYVGGREAEILRTNAVFRGVLVPSGSHEVLYRYEPLSLRAGAAIAAATAVLLALGALASRRRGRRYST